MRKALRSRALAYHAGPSVDATDKPWHDDDCIGHRHLHRHSRTWSAN